MIWAAMYFSVLIHLRKDFELAANVVDGVVALPERHDLVADCLRGPGRRTAQRYLATEPAELVTQHAKRGWRVVEPSRDVC
jgi:hypothetical protein